MENLNERYILWADEFILKTSNNLAEVLNTAKLYSFKDSEYNKLTVMDMDFDEILWEDYPLHGHCNNVPEGCISSICPGTCSKFKKDENNSTKKQ